MKIRTGQKGFSIVELVLIVVAIGLIGGVGWWAYQQNRPKVGDAANGGNSQTGNDPATPTNPGDGTKYLDVKELGVRLKLTGATKDAYYALSEQITTATGKPAVYLSTRSLDNYKECNASPTSFGVAAIGTYLEGYEDEIVGRYSDAYPNAPKIDDIYYRIVGNQYDCTLGENTGLYQSVRKAFIESYSTIEKMSE